MASGKPKGHLPHNWEVHVSASHPDRVYYFNTVTGASTWDLPTLIPAETPSAVPAAKVSETWSKTVR